MFNEEELIIIKHMALNNKAWAEYRLNKQIEDEEQKIKTVDRINLYQQIADKIEIEVIRVERKSE